jgi:hypothetical protein
MATNNKLPSAIVMMADNPKEEKAEVGKKKASTREMRMDAMEDCGGMSGKKKGGKKC